MKILVDTNILISAILFPQSKPAKALLYVSEHHEMILCERNVFEFREVLRRKAANALPNAEILLSELSYKLIPVVCHSEKLIRDANDQPILDAAVDAGVDMILTGDKDFLSLDIKHPKCITVTQFLEMEEAAGYIFPR